MIRGGAIAQQASNKLEHRLLPGIRAAELQDPNWPRVFHDQLATAFSPLSCGMKAAPREWATIKVGGMVRWVRVVHPPMGDDSLLVDDGRLRLISADGKVLWARAAIGDCVATGDLRQDGGNYALFTSGPGLVLCDLHSGETIWQKRFEPAYVTPSVKVADILPEAPGLEAAVVFTHGDEACVVNFPPRAEPKVVWQRKVVDGDFNERYDHHSGTLEVDLSVPDQPIIWNIRRHRCRCIDARTGGVLSAVSYQVGGAERRNYGPCQLGRGRDGQLYACVFGEFVQEHVHAIRLRRGPGMELAWQHYYGEVYQDAPGVMLVSHGVVDYDGDGGDEMVYSVRDPALGLRSFVRFRDVATGEIKFELADHWGTSLFSGIGADKASGLLAFPAANGETPEQGALQVYRFARGQQPKLLHEFADARCAGVPTVEWNGTKQLLIHAADATHGECMQRCDIRNGKLVIAANAIKPAPVKWPMQAIVPRKQGEPLFVVSHDGELQADTWNGNTAWKVPLEGGSPALLSAADLNGDHRAELIAITPDNRLRAYSFGDEGRANELVAIDQIGASQWSNPIVVDLDRSGRPCLIAVCRSSSGRLLVRAVHSDGSELWHAELKVPAAQVARIVINTGRFLGTEHVGVAVSIADSRNVHEGTYMLDGVTGKELWFKGMYRNGSSVFPYRPNGIPTAVDFDGDDVEEVGMDMMSYMAYLNGKNGDFVFIHPSRNIQMDGGLFAGHLYNTFCPVYRSAQDVKPHWFVTAGFGPFGMMKPDPREGIWKEDLDYDVPANIALVDVDGDHSLEAGYAALNDKTFFCRDAWTGKVKWQLPLPYAPNSVTITADFDGDGKGEFLCGPFCIGTNAEGRGELRWQLPRAVASPLVADFDGDGVGEIAGAIGGKILVYKAVPTK